LDFKALFDEHTLSVHLKQGSPPLAKKGVPGNWTCVELQKDTLSAEQLSQFVDYLLSDQSSVEFSYEGSFIIQKDGFRIVGARPPLVNTSDITIVRNTKQFSLKELAVSEELKNRILHRSEGIVIAGSPGEGKSTLAQAIIAFLVEQRKIVKTIEMPRDLRVPACVSQYSLAHASEGELHDLLLLSRPDYTVFDEMRKSNDFSLYVDLRLAGIGMIGVVHGASPLDAIARFVGKIELGMIPQIVDRIIFVNAGKISQELTLSLEVGVPEGLAQADLSRPMVVVRDARTAEQIAQLYAFGNETVLMPTKNAVSTKPVAQMVLEPVLFELKVQDHSLLLVVDARHASEGLFVTLDGVNAGHVLVGKKGTIKIREDSVLAKTMLEGLKEGKKVMLGKMQNTVQNKQS